MSQIVFNNVVKTYGQTHALAGVDCTVTSGVTTALIGPSGSGKSTLLQLINGVVAPSSGSVEVFGERIDYGALPALRLKIGYAVQGTGLFPHMTIEQNITLLARLESWDKARMQARTAELINLVEFDAAFLGRYPHELSGGQQQRAGLCRAMMLNPPVLLLDETFGALDPITRKEIHREFLKMQAAEPRTIVMVTHDLAEAIKLADHIMLLHDGQIVQSGLTADVVDKPANAFVADFFQSSLES